jgi:hypothetical protein
MRSVRPARAAADNASRSSASAVASFPSPSWQSPSASHVPPPASSARASRSFVHALLLHERLRFLKELLGARAIDAEVARALGKGRTQVYRWLERFAIDATQFRY